MQTSLPHIFRRLLLLNASVLSMQVAFAQAPGLSLKPKDNSQTTLIRKFEKSYSNPTSTATEPVITHFTKECKTMEADAYLRKKIARLGTGEDFEADLQKNIHSYKERMRAARTEATVYTIPVIFHVVHNGEPIGTGSNISAAQIQSQIDVLNEDFRRKSGTPGFNNNPLGADMEIEFALALRDPEGNPLPEPGIHRVNGKKASWITFESEDEPGDIQLELKPKTIWNPEQYFNIWSLNISDNIIGEAQFPIRSNLAGLDLDGYPTGATTDGVILSYRVIGRTGNVAPGFTGRTATHEIGHWLGLRHIWGDDNGGCAKDDFCNDTPKTADKHRGCSTGHDSCTEPGKDMIENYMDYSDDDCVNIFTQDQKTRMRTVLETCPRRKELLSSTVHIPVNNSTKPIADFIASRDIACVGNAIEFTDKSLGNVTSWSWAFFNSAGTNVGNFSGQNQTISFNTSGVYTARLIVTNAAGKDTLTNSNYITVLPTVNLTFPFNEAFESASGLTDWILYNPDADRNWVLTDKASANGNGVKSAAFDNFSGDKDNNPYGTIDGLISPKINLATNQFAELSFDVAYARYDQDLSDTLSVLYSTDCGQTFTILWQKGGHDLATAPDAENSFVPTSSQWRKETISLGFLNGNANVYLAIVNKSSWGNNIYLDNINIGVPVATQKPTPAFTTALRTVCTGTTVQINDVSQNAPRTWSWTFAGGTPATSTEQHPKVTYNTPGTYQVTLTASNSFGGATVTQQAFITVAANPVPQVLANKTLVCAGDSVVLTASGAISYRWFEGTDFLGEGNSITVKPFKNTTYRAAGKNVSDCEGSSSIQINVKAAPAQPTISISAPSDSATVTLTSSAADTYQWLRNGVVIPGATNRTYNVTQAGSYSVRITSGECFNISDAAVLTASDYDQVAKQDIKLYPNPVADKLHIQLPPVSGNATYKISIYNSLGMLVDELLTNAGHEDLQLIVSNYARGRYVILISNENIHYTQSFIKQ